MSLPRRRSSRLNGGNTATPAKLQNKMSGLTSLLERDESPGFGVQSSLDAIVSSPMGPRPRPAASSPAQTPSAAGRLYPSRDEMHPSKVQHSTTKQPDSGLRFGFIDAASRTAPPKTGHGVGPGQDTPSKSKGFFSKLPSSPNFSFKARNTDAELSPEAKKMMNEVRDVASSLKMNFMSQHEQEQQEAGAASNDLFGAGGRKMATPKGRAGRFSDVHMAEFKKMDSIAGHPSSFRAQQGRPEPAAKSLKRTKSQAKLDEGDRTSSGASTARPGETQAQSWSPKKLSPMKRFKQNDQDDTSTARPVSREGQPTLARSKSGIPSAITTPTKASLARSASAKAPKTSLLPVSRTPSTRRLLTGPRTDGNKKYLSSLAKFGNVRSILRRPQTDAAQTEQPLATSPTSGAGKPAQNREKELPSLPETPKPAIYKFPSMKHVTFSPSGTGKQSAQNSPSPVKTAAVPPAPAPSPTKSQASDVTYPSLPGTPVASPTKAFPPTPGDFTFRADKSIKFGPPASHGATIRQVRPSIVPSAPAAGAGSATAAHATLPSVPHGMSNKKRHRDGPDSDDEKENEREQDDDPEPQAKRRKGGPASAASPSPLKSSPTKSRLSSSPTKYGRGRKAGAGAKSPGMLSLSRLNALARPKGR